MSRDITSDFETEVDADLLRPAILIKAEFESGDVLAWTGVGSINFNSESYTGLGELLGISVVQETQKMEANGLQFTLTGLDSSLISIALNDEYQWRPITMWFAVLNPDFSIIADPYKIFSGRMDIMEITDSGNDSSIVLNAENNLIDLKENRERRYTPEDQKRYFTGDLGLDFVPNIQEIEILWGSS